jgi:hypothetical protein
VYLKEISTGIYTEKTEVTHFNFDANPPTKITFLTAPSSLYQVHIVRSNPLTQTTDYLNTGPFLAETHEGALDKMTKLMQELDARSVQKNFYDSVSNVLPVTENSKVLGTDSSGDWMWYTAGTATVISVSGLSANAGITFSGQTYTFFNDNTLPDTDFSQKAYLYAAGLLLRSEVNSDKFLGFYFNGAANGNLVVNDSAKNQGAGISRVLYSEGYSSSSADVKGATLGNKLALSGGVLDTKSPTVDTTASGTFTITIATPGVITKSTHGLVNGDKVWFDTTGALPTGVSKHTVYYVVNAATNTFEVSSSLGGASINTSGSQSGTHSLSKVVAAGSMHRFSIGVNATTATGASIIPTALSGITGTGKHIKVALMTGYNSSLGAVLQASSTAVTGSGTFGIKVTLLKNNSAIAVFDFQETKNSTSGSEASVTNRGGTNLEFIDTTVAAGQDALYQFKYQATGSLSNQVDVSYYSMVTMEI